MYKYIFEDMNLLFKYRMNLAWAWFVDGPGTVKYAIAQKKLAYLKRLIKEVEKKVTGKAYNPHLINGIASILESKPRIKIRAGVCQVPEDIA